MNTQQFEIIFNICDHGDKDFLSYEEFICAIRTLGFPDDTVEEVRKQCKEPVRMSLKEFSSFAAELQEKERNKPQVTNTNKDAPSTEKKDKEKCEEETDKSKLSIAPTPSKMTPSDAENGRYVDWSAVETQLIILPEHSDQYGRLLPANLMAWIDIAAGITSKRHCSCQTVTIGVEEFHWLQQLVIGDYIKLTTKVSRSFNTSMEVIATVVVYDPETKKQNYCCVAVFIFALVDRTNAPVPPVIPRNNQEIRCFEAAGIRRNRRINSRNPKTKTRNLIKKDLEEGLPNRSLLDLNGNEAQGIYSTSVSVTELVLPSHTNTVGIAFGGQTSKWMYNCAFLAASNFCDSSQMVLGSVENFLFLDKIRIGDVVVLTGKVTKAFDYCVEVMVVAEKENPFKKERSKCCTATFVFIPVDDYGSPVPNVKQVIPLTMEETDAFEEADRRQHRREKKRKKLLFEYFPESKILQSLLVLRESSTKRYTIIDDYKLLALCFILPPAAVALMLLQLKKNGKQPFPRHTNKFINLWNVIICLVLTLIAWIPGICYALMNYIFISVVIRFEELNDLPPGKSAVPQDQNAKKNLSSLF